MEQESYDNEVNDFILKETMSRKQREAAAEKDESIPLNDYQELVDFKQQVQHHEEQKTQEAKITRAIPRKGKNPEAHRKDFDAENAEFGVKNEVDLVLEHIAGEKHFTDTSQGFIKAKGLYDR